MRLTTRQREPKVSDLPPYTHSAIAVVTGDAVRAETFTFVLDVSAITDAPAGLRYLAGEPCVAPPVRGGATMPAPHA